MINVDEIKIALNQEREKLISELSCVAHKNPEISGDWQPSAPDLNNPTADINDVADSIEAFEENSAIEVELEARLMEVNDAIEQIQIGTYGVCRVCNSAIEDARLHANYAAKTCIAHR